jgi:hypothetical protein
MQRDELRRLQAPLKELHRRSSGGEDRRLVCSFVDSGVDDGHSDRCACAP